MHESLQAYRKQFVRVLVRFRSEYASPMREYFPDCTIDDANEGHMHMSIEVPMQERHWQGLLLSFGDAVTVIDPPEYRDLLSTIAQNFLRNCDM